jgi:drug/metabolite transporter (DMT)-like permease
VKEISKTEIAPRQPAAATEARPLPESRRQLVGLGFVLLSATGFGVLGPAARFAYTGGANVQTVGTVRFLLAAVLLWGWAALRRRIRPVGGRQLGQLALLGGVGYALQSALFFTSVHFITPDLAALLLYTFPALVVLLSALLLRERLTRTSLTVVILCTAGAALTAGGGGQIHPLGVAAALGAAFVYAGYILYSRVVLRSVDPLLATCWVVTFAGLSYALVTFPTGAFVTDIGPSGWIALGVIALFSTVVAVLCFFLGVIYIGPTRTALASTFEPVATIALSIPLFGVMPARLQWVGAALVLGGVVLQVMPASSPGAAAGRVASTSLSITPRHPQRRGANE